ncbi:NADH:ubiquinone oxidoreductase subunit 6 (subunit J) [Microbacterium halimionae]|uniref:NADH:ubiquinone oxidoreductase subunit 6 (Subunit J) n=1 Tax=Microbacterium halimionae TaxID=1526413 RepID=A0A7W3JR17_9MICO|nr:SHOCT domain-containing protein [Microbacterium halimionae]MBA8817323.1 NADH:ubiquinone oxidoreductase subunit 6 (subunit J) [Microbacterium halimionae]NII95957.1 NADH:ubiquinone oxidoreductase subunit 6 (subunit J) [Microbacterium halimionae]
MHVFAQTVEYQGFWGSLGETIWWFLSIIILVGYIFALFAIVSDIFRDHTLAGGWKALWLLFIIFFMFLGPLVYLIVRGGGMGERSAAQAKQFRDAQDSYIKQVAGTSPTEEIAKAKEMLDAGAITAAEFEQLKAKALS